MPRSASAHNLLPILELLTGRVGADGERLGPRREPTRARIVVAAAQAFLTHGYRGARVDDIATAAQVTRPTLYAYFDSKERLLIAAMAEETLVQLSEVEALFDPERPAEDRLADWLGELIRYIGKAPLTARMARDREPEVVRILTEHELARAALGQRPDLDKGRLFAGLIQEAFGDRYTEEEAQEIASLMRALSHMAPTLLDERARFGLSIDRLADRLASLLLDGLRAGGR